MPQPLQPAPVLTTTGAAGGGGGGAGSAPTSAADDMIRNAAFTAGLLEGIRGEVQFGSLVASTPREEFVKFAAEILKTSQLLGPVTWNCNEIRQLPGRAKTPNMRAPFPGLKTQVCPCLDSGHPF